MPKGEGMQPNQGQRDGLFHVSLPGISRDPLWIEHMEQASQKAVELMRGASPGAEIFTDSERNISIFVDRLRRSYEDNEDSLLHAAELRLLGFFSKPTLRDITDYILAEAQFKYSQHNPKFQPRDNGMGGVSQTISNYGTPRELMPAFETSFDGRYEVNPYQGYAERARRCKEEYLDAEGYMRAPLARLVLDPAKGYTYEQAHQEDEELKLTKTGNDYWWHTDVKHLDVIWDHINTLYTDLAGRVASYESTESKALLISQIAWWYFQAMPYTRGSAGIGNVLLQSLFDFSGIENSPYMEGVAPDLEALVTPLPMYAEKFEDFFTEKFEPLRS